MRATGTLCVTATLKRTENFHQGLTTEISLSASSWSGITSLLHIVSEGTTSGRSAELSAGGDKPTNRFSCVRRRRARLPARLLGEHHRVVGECFELERISGGIEEETGRLLACLPFEADLRLDDEVEAGSL